VEEGAPGHGCGHNLLGTGCLAAALAVREWLAVAGRAGTVRYYGCPAEERGSAKVLMARAGAFDDLAAAFNFHPGYANYAAKGSMIGVNEVRYRFHGKAAHAAALPHLGRSALDAVELMNVGVNYLREHILDSIRIHYVISDGGQAPNIVPERAEGWYFIRAVQPAELAEVAKRVSKVAQGAAMMTETRLEEILESAVASVLNNHILADMQYEAMQSLGPIEFSAEEMAFAQAINGHSPPGAAAQLAGIFGLSPDLVSGPLLGDVLPSVDEGKVLPGSTDVGDMSWKVPLSMLWTACFPLGAPVHSWGAVAASGSAIGHKGMIYAAKVMALTALELYRHPEKLAAVRRGFEASIARRPYVCLLPDDYQPPQHEHPYR
jgi:aminobenzoyl-glutamate utilization protein B